jgi:ABC-type multidrug transport system fused ATPase/permease subunit
MNLLKGIWQLLDRGQRRQLVLLHAGSLVMAASTLAGIAAVVPFFAVLGDSALINRSVVLFRLYAYFGFTDQRHFQVALGISFLCLVLLANAINLSGSIAMNRFAHRIGNHFCITLFDEYIHRDHQFHMASNSATLFNNIVWQVTRGVTGILQSLFILSTNAVTGLLIMVFIVFVNPLIAFATVAALTGSYGLIYLLARQRLLNNGMLENLYTEERTKTVSETLGAIREVIVSGRQAFFRERFQRSCWALSRAALNTHAISQSPRPILECIVVAGLVGATLLLVNRGEQGRFWLAQISLLGFAAYRLLPALQQIFHAIVKIRADRVAFACVADDLRCAFQEGRTNLQKRVASHDASWPGRPHNEILLTHVDFRYASDRPLAIRQATLRISAGTTVGLVGPSGSGKTTLAELILGLLAPTSGTIAVDGILLDMGNRAGWRATIGYVPQHPYLFDASLAENIALATKIEQIDFERLSDAVRLAQLDELVRAFPKGYAEIIGERGVRLSGGQRQRIGIARALYRRTSVLIFDEATNALDGMTENEIMSTLETLRGSHTVILIAHRMRTVRACDAIFELDNGRIIGSGTFEELTRLSSGFRSLLHDAARPAGVP